MSDDDPFRTAPARPAALVALVETATAGKRLLPHDAELEPASQRALRVRFALGATKRRIRWSVASVFGALWFIIGLTDPTAEAGMAVMGAVLAVGGVAIDAIQWRLASRDVARRLVGDTSLPFPVVGYEHWLASDRPLFDVHLRGPVAHQLVIDAAVALAEDTTIEWQSELVFRVVIPPIVVGRGGRFTDAGDARRWRIVSRQLLLPLHQDVGIDHVDMGGTVRPRQPRLIA
jgi:hypothetical protein